MDKSRSFDSALLQHVSPLGWEHINLTGDYTWHTNKRVAKGEKITITRHGIPAAVLVPVAETEARLVP